MKVSKLVTYSTVGALCVILLILVVRIAPPLLMASRSTPVTPTVTSLGTEQASTSTPSVLSAITTPTAPPSSVNAASGQETTTEIPLCTFEPHDAPTSTVSTLLDTYILSEPEVIMTSTTAIRLFQWLPDSQSLLIGRNVDGKPEEVIEVFDLQTGATQEYAQARIVGDKVAWLEAEQAVVFVESTLNNVNSLRLSHGSDEPIQELATDFRSSFSVKRDGEQLVFSANDQGGQLQILQITDRTVSPLLTQLSGYYRTISSADETQIAVYNHQHFYLADLTSEQLCEIDLGQVGTGEYSKVRASDVAWSTDGRYFAMRMVYGNPEQFLGLRIIDILTKRIQDVDIEGRSVHGLNWSPNDNVLLVAVDANPDPSLGSFDNLYLLDIATYSFRPILSEHQFFGAGYDGTLWSPNGKSIGLACPDFVPPDEMREWRICMIYVETE